MVTTEREAITVGTTGKPASQRTVVDSFKYAGLAGTVSSVDNSDRGARLEFQQDMIPEIGYSDGFESQGPSLDINCLS
jgi:hypothetical protein